MTSHPLLLSGAVAGAASAFAFTAPTATGWWLFNGIRVTLLVLLGLAEMVGLVTEAATEPAAPG